VFASLLDVAADLGDRPTTVNNNVERVTGPPAQSIAERLQDNKSEF
jgi:hypothetical protein